MSLAHHLRNTLVVELARLRRADAPVRLLLIAAFVALALGLGHVAVWAVDGGSWSGPVAWRKPIVFGVSIAATTFVLAWVLAQLPPARGRMRAAIVYVAAIALEYGLIAMQRWRGVASHFNTATAFDGAVFTAMGVLIMIAAVVIVGWTIVAARTPELAPDRKAAIVGGMVLLDVGMAVGVSLSVLGGLPPGLVPAALLGSLKPTHAVALHGLQALPLLWVWLSHREPDTTARAQRLIVASIGYGLLFAALPMQLAGGPTLVAAMLALGGLLALAWSALAPARADHTSSAVSIEVVR